MESRCTFPHLSVSHLYAVSGTQKFLTIIIPNAASVVWEWIHLPYFCTLYPSLRWKSLNFEKPSNSMYFNGKKGLLDIFPHRNAFILGLFCCFSLVKKWISLVEQSTIYISIYVYIHLPRAEEILSTMIKLFSLIFFFLTPPFFPRVSIHFGTAQFEVILPVWCCSSFNFSFSHTWGPNTVCTHIR